MEATSKLGPAKANHLARGDRQGRRDAREAPLPRDGPGGWRIRGAGGEWKEATPRVGGAAGVFAGP